ncbi:MAG: DNA recombination protein RmuC [Cyclobacteriaceae bacterium]
MEILFLITGLIIGAVAVWFIARFYYQNQKSDNQLVQDLQVEFKLVSEKLKNAEERITAGAEDVRVKQEEIIRLNSENAALLANQKNLQERMAEHQEEIQNLQEKFTTEFKNVANEILEEKSKKFTDQNKTNLDELLKPLGEKINQFEKKVEEANKDSLERNSALKEQLTNLKDLNTKMTKEAENLTKALKGDSQARGTWGEFILESILEKSGLEKGREYFMQETLRNEEGRRFRPDVIIRLPDSKNIIIDSKVSLVSYDKYVNTEDDEEKARHLKAHIAAIRFHVKTLSEKNYQQLYKLDSLDYVLMFIPIEPCFLVAIQNDHQLYDDAHDKNIIIVSPTNLIATLRTITSMWKQEYQNQNAMEIARQGGSLYDKFVAFTEELLKVGNYLKKSQSSYEDAMGKLSTGKDNLVRKTERLKELGAKTSKQQDERILDRSADEEEVEQRQLF